MAALSVRRDAPHCSVELLPRLDYFAVMLTEFIAAAMRQAHYELLENGKFFGFIPACRGCWAEATSLELCREELKSTLEDWLLLGLQLGHRIPIIDGVNLNRPRSKKVVHAKANQA